MKMGQRIVGVELQYSLKFRDRLLVATETQKCASEAVFEIVMIPGWRLVAKRLAKMFDRLVISSVNQSNSAEVVLLKSQIRTHAAVDIGPDIVEDLFFQALYLSSFVPPGGDQILVPCINLCL